MKNKKIKILENNFLKNKKSQVSIVILVLGVLVICSLVLFSFFLVDSNIKKDFSILKKIEIVLGVGEFIEFYSEETGRVEIKNFVEGTEKFKGNLKMDLAGKKIIWNELGRKNFKIEYTFKD